MKSGFAHFDGSDRENFSAAVLLLTMEVDHAVQRLVARMVRERLGVEPERELLAFGREARLEETDDGYARVDLWLLFGPKADARYAFVELKTHDRWDERHVAHQVRDQAARRVVRGVERRVCGSVLLASERLCKRVRTVDVEVPCITWPQIIAELRALAVSSDLAKLTVQHLEETMERPPGLDRSLTLAHFEQATTTVACLRQFLVDCVRDIGGHVHGDPMWLTPGDGQPRRGSGWAWHGLSVPFMRGGQKGRVGVYKYAEAPPGEEHAKETLWLEGYLGDDDEAKAFIEFAPPSLSTANLDAARARFAAECGNRLPAPKAGVAAGARPTSSPET